jgi:hypothetical protein
LGNRDPNATRPISKALYERVYIDRDSVVAQYQLDHLANSGASPYDLSGTAILTAWLNRLNQPDTKDARRVEVKINTLQTFDFLQVSSFFCVSNFHFWCWQLLIFSKLEKGKGIEKNLRYLEDSNQFPDDRWLVLVAAHYEAFERYRVVMSPILILPLASGYYF